ncbi:TerC family protein [Buchnera aphidicola]|uniref:TerC family protein n=1 Tax=Buchnera aphidicola TaxID=9 RepID=UPI0034639645
MNIFNQLVLWMIFFVVIILTFLCSNYIQIKYFYTLNTLKKSYFFLLFWIFSTFIFTFLIWIYYFLYFNQNIANTILTSFFLSFGIEQILSLDNVLIWILLFKYFMIPINYQKKVLMYGILVSFIFRMLLILISYWFILRWNWIIFIFGIILLFSGIEMLLVHKNNDKKSFKKDIFFLLLVKIFRITNRLYGDKFFVYKEKFLYITPLLVSLIMIEISDIIFAVDSVPIILSFVQNLFIVISSNIFSILILRSIYFILSNFIYKRKYIQYILSIMIIIISLNIIFSNYIYVLENMTSVIITIIFMILLIYNFSIKNIFT